MPCVPAEEDHREKVVKVARSISAMVSRPVGRAEMLTNTKAMDSMKKEWKGLIDQGVFDLSVIREYYDVAREAKQKNEEVHMARAHGIIAEKHSQLSEEDPRRKYKGRGWCLGTRLRTTRRTRHCFKIWGILLQLSKLPDGLTDGMCRWLMRYRRISRPHCGEGVPEDDKERWNQFKRPVVRLVKAWHGHPDAGTFWEQHCDESVRSMGFQPVGEEWPSVYTHPELQSCGLCGRL